MEARTVADAANVQVGTLNSWVQRGLVPGMSIGARGRVREVTLDSAIAIGIICTLVRHGISAPRASKIAEKYLNERPRKGRVLLSPLVEIGNLRPNNIEIGVQISFNSERELPKILKEEIKPLTLTSYIILNVEEIAQTMQAYEERWQQDHQAKGR